MGNHCTVRRSTSETLRLKTINLGIPLFQGTESMERPSPVSPLSLRPQTLVFDRKEKLVIKADKDPFTCPLGSTEGRKSDLTVVKFSTFLTLTPSSGKDYHKGLSLRERDRPTFSGWITHPFTHFVQRETDSGPLLVLVICSFV